MKARLTLLGSTIVFLLAVVAAGATSGEATVLLASDVTVRQPQFNLADVLPINASEGLRARAAEVSLGDSPMPGEHRVLDHAFLWHALDKLPELRKALEIPPRVDVTRWSRRVSSDNLLEPIAKALASADLVGPAALSAADITLLSPVIATEEHLEARVLRIDSEGAAQGVRARMWIPSEPRVPPFWARVRIGKTAVSPEAIRLTASTGASGPAAPTTQAQQTTRSTIVFDKFGRAAESKASPILVRSGRPVELIVDAGSMRITSRAVSLEVGHAGDSVRVRVDPAGKILIGKVVASETVEVSY